MKQSQHGVAIVLAMGVVAFAAVAATAILASQSIWSRQVELAANRVQARNVLQAGTDWARELLYDDQRSGDVDHPGEPWALRLPPMPIDNGELLGKIDDQQGAFNLNSLVTDGKVNLIRLTQFRRLLALLGLPPDLAYNLADWIDQDSLPQPEGGSEDDDYLTANPPYLAANRPLIDVAELALIRGFDDPVRTRLRPFVAALPGTVPLNVNTASAEVLASMVEGLDLNTAQALVAQRGQAYYRNREDFLKRLPRKVAPPTGDISVSSNFFLANLRVSVGDARTSGMVLLQRRSSGWPVVIWRKYL